MAFWEIFTNFWNQAMDKKIILILVVLAFLFIAGCGEIKYICPDGSTVNNPNECNNNSTSQKQKVFLEPFRETCELEKLGVNISDYTICRTTNDCPGFCDTLCIRKGDDGQEGSSGLDFYYNPNSDKPAFVSCLCKCYKYE